jgi:hypothetical protein
MVNPPGRYESRPERKEREIHMDIGKAIDEMKAGRLVRRPAWNGKGMHVYIEDAHQFKIGDGVYKGEARRYEPHVVLFNARGSHQPGWVCSQEDLLATDWEIAE